MEVRMPSQGQHTVARENNCNFRRVEYEPNGSEGRQRVQLAQCCTAVIALPAAVAACTDCACRHCSTTHRGAVTACAEASALHADIACSAYTTASALLADTAASILSRH